VKITRLHVENYKRISVAEILLDPDAAGTVSLMGPNEAGKSSMLDAFEALIAGRNAPKRAMPIRRGADSAEIIGEFRDDDGSHIVVTRRYRANGTTTIDVREDGLRKAKPDAILSKLYSHVALDPLAFANLKPKEQVDTLVRLSGFDPSAIDEKAADVFATRTEVNSEVRRIEAGIDGIPNVPELQGVDLVSVGELVQQLEELRGRNRQRESNDDEIRRNLQEDESLRAQLRALQDRLDATVVEREQLEAKSGQLGEWEDPQPIANQIGEAESTNERIRVQQARDAAEAKLDEQRGLAANLTKRLEDLAIQKREGFAKADMPVPGLTIEGEQVLLDGTPFTDTSAGRKLRTSAAIAMRLNPELRAIVIRDGSLLDAENRRIVDELAVEHDFTVLMEIVDENAPTGVIFEDGTVAGTKGAAS
jgi:hypothetical protein